MGWKDLAPADVQNNRCHLEVSRAAGLQLDDTSVQVITNRGAVAKSLPLSAARISGNTATWDFSLPGNQPGAQLRALSTTLPLSQATAFNAPPLPLPQGSTAPLTVVLDASPTGRAERYYYIRVQQTDGTVSYAAPVWIHRDYRIAGGDDGLHPPRAANVVSYTWEYGDGTVETESRTDNVAATPDFVSAAFDGQAMHTYQAAGDYYPRVTATYDDGTKDCAVAHVYVGSGPVPTFYGDVNGDGQINSEDVTALTQMVAGLTPTTSAQMTRSDVYPPAANDPVQHRPGDGKLTMLDAVRLARFLEGSRGVWP
jgi:hypothetical protein